MTGYECVLESIEIFERSLGSHESIRSVAALARRAGYSVYHFSRLFSAVVGISPKDYILGRILSEAACAIVGSTKSLSAIAVEAGYPDYETFSRAFKRRFGAAPSAVRERGSLPRGLTARKNPREREPGLSFDFSARSFLNPETANLEPFRLVGLPFYIEDGTPSFHSQWNTFMGIQTRVASRVEPETFYQFSSWTDDDTFSGLSILCALETDGASSQEPLFSVRDVPRATYLKFRHVGPIAEIHLMYEFIYRGWLAANDVRLAGFWEFQRYADGGATTEIFIPIDIASSR